MKKQGGFTLVELVIVIILIGVLSVVAVPKFIDLKASGQAAATTGVAGALGAASNINYVTRKADASKGSAVANCTDVGNLMVGGLPTGYTITSAAIVADVTVSCTLTDASGATATFTALGIS